MIRLKGSMAKTDEQMLLDAVSSVDPSIKLFFVSDQKSISDLGTLVGKGERLNCLSTILRADVLSSLRFDEGVRTFDGIELSLLPPPEKHMYQLLRYDSANEYLNLINRKQPNANVGLVYMEWIKQVVESSWSVGLLSISKTTTSYADRSSLFFKSGRAFQRLWLAATSLGYSFQPLGVLPMLGLITGTQFETYVSSATHSDLEELRNSYLNIFFQQNKNEKPDSYEHVILFRLFKMSANNPNEDRSLRKPIAEFFSFTNAGQTQELSEEEEDEDVVEKECEVAEVTFPFKPRNEREIGLQVGAQFAVYVVRN